MHVLAELVALLAPPGCLACRRALPRAGERLCVDCTRALPWLREGCRRCGLPAHRRKRCPAAGASFPRAWAPLAYQGVARNLVAGLKFRAAVATADLMAAQMTANLPPDLRGVAGRGGEAAVAGDVVALVPVPAMPTRRRARGFDPARALTVALARRTGLPLADCLVRLDRLHRQVGASRKERRASGRLRIEVRGTAPSRAVLVDDVHTTGATLEACAQALGAAGTTVLAVVSYARTL
jgi:predicted amidophosphoribosyltransferase